VVAKGTEDEAYVYGDPFGYEKVVSGRIPPNKTNYEVEAALPDPALLCAEAMYLSLNKYGIRCNIKLVETNYKKANAPVNLPVLYTHYSPTLDNIVLYTNLKSNNLYCESLLLTLGKGSIAAGTEAVKNYWQKRGLETTEVFMSDGSGLSRSNNITTHFQTSLLCKMYRDSTHYRAFNNSLPVAGKSGSMANIGKGTYIEKNLRAKTGYINRARGYCGYVKSKSGKEVAFSILFNNYNFTAREAKLELEKFMIAVGEF
jgi:D-alanyl-D-alanine carboxypeptidase/D-alanyl-D-alanine-endopeptidase (penicillin-binding protein 4)